MKQKEVLQEYEINHKELSEFEQRIINQNEKTG